MSNDVRVALIDLSLNPAIYSPVDHWTRFLDVSWEAFRPMDGRFPDLRGFSHVLLTGSEASILRREPWAERAVDLTRRAVARGLAVLGSCYGHQLLALALAGPRAVRRCPVPEVGWVSVSKPKPSRLLGEAGEFHTFTLHFDEVTDLPDRFLTLASTETCGVQAFALRDKPVWGIQPHPEIDVRSGQRLLCDMASLQPEFAARCRRALESEPRDSGAAELIIRAFLEGRAENGPGT